MQLSITNHTLDKLETLLKEMGFQIRYEKGNFKSGSCKVLDSKIIVINKFSTIESKIISMANLITTTTIDDNLLSEKNRAYYHTLKQTTLAF